MTHQVWYIHQDGRQYGPITERELHYLARLSKLDPDAHVWSARLPKWRRARELDGLYEPPPLDGDADGAAPEACPPDAAASDRTGGARSLREPAAESCAQTEIMAEIMAENGVRQSAAARAAARPAEPRPAQQAKALSSGRKMVAMASAPALPTPTVPDYETEKQDHANDNLARAEERAISQRLVDRVASLERAFDKEAHERRQLKSAIEALIDFLAAEPDTMIGSDRARRLPTSHVLAPPRAEKSDPSQHAPRPRRRGKTSAPVDAEVVAPSAALTPRPNYFLNHWTGTHSLGRSFWANAFTPSLALTLVMAMLYASMRHSSVWLEVSLIGASAGAAPILSWSLVGLWRAANRSRMITGSVIFPSLAKSWMVLTILIWLSLCTILKFTPTWIPESVLSVLDVTTYLVPIEDRGEDPTGKSEREPPPASPKHVKPA